MKPTLAALLLTIIFGTNALARVFTVSLEHTNDVTAISINGKKMPREEAIGIYKKLGSLDHDQVVYVVIGRDVPATYLVETIHHLQEAAVKCGSGVMRGGDGQGKWFGGCCGAGLCRRNETSGWLWPVKEKPSEHGVCGFGDGFGVLLRDLGARVPPLAAGALPKRAV